MKSWLVNKLAGYGIGSVIPDSMRYTITEEQDETIIERYSAYKNQEGFVGFMIWDEPITVAPYGRPARLLSQLGFDAIVNVNLSPEDPGKFDEKIYDYMSAVNMEGLKYLTYDQYPYAAGRKDFAPNVYYSLDALRKAGLAYNSDTGCYLQAFESARYASLPTASCCSICRRRFHTVLKTLNGFFGLPRQNTLPTRFLT